MNKKIIILIGVVLFSVIGLGTFIILGKNAEVLPVAEETINVPVKDEVESVSGDTNQLEGINPGESLKDPRGFEIDPGLIEFTAKLNEVNNYVYANLENFQSGSEIDEIYRELWGYGESFGLRFSAVLTNDSIEAGDSEFTPQLAYFLNITTKDNIKYCAVDEKVLDPNYDPDQPLRQSIIAESCDEYLAKYRAIIEEDISSNQSDGSSTLTEEK